MAQDEQGADAPPGRGDSTALPSTVKTVGRFVIDPKAVILESWDALFEKSFWVNTTKTPRFAFIVGAITCFIVIAIFRFSGFDLLYGVPTQMRLPALKNTPILKDASWISSSYVDTDVSTALRQAGIKYVSFRDFSQTEDDRLKGLIAGASKIDFLAYNAESLTSSGKFDDVFKAFFNKQDAVMNVLMADPTSQFYDENPPC